MAELEIKQYDSTVERRTIVDTPPVEERQQPSARTFLLQVAESAQSITPWGYNPVLRDRELRGFWHSESWLASVVYSVSIRNASFAWHVVGSNPEKPQPRNTVNAVTSILKNSDRGKGWRHLILKTCIDLYCLAGSTRISLGGDRRGQTKTIAQIVRDNDPGPVLSVDEHGKIVEKAINQWHKTPLGNRKWYWLSTTFNNHAGKYRGGIFLTEDHPMLTQRGWVQAKDITVDDRIATRDPDPSVSQMEILVGGLLGDMSMTKLPKRALIRFSHSVDQADYLEFKKNLFGGFEWTGQKVYHSKQCGNGFIGVNSRASLGLVGWYDRWYGGGKKKINRVDFQTYFSPRMMAIWYMDDGSASKLLTTAGNISENANLFTNGFSEDDVDWMVNFLNEKGFDCKKYILYDQYPVIHFSAEGFRTLTQYIGAYIIPSMRYKLGKDAPEYDPSVWKVEPAGIFYDQVDIVEQRDYKIGNGNVCQTTYHIGVEDTRNFVAAGLVSHNTQDNASFWEIIRNGNSPTSPVINIAHLDSARCQRTGNPKYPVIYTNRFGIEKVLPYWKVRTIEEMPSPIEGAFDMQYSAVSRALMAAEIIQSISTYKLEKVSGNFTRAIDAISGLTQSNIDDALMLAEEQTLNKGLYRYSLPIIVPGVDPTSSLSHVHIDLASLPDNFDEDTSFKWYVAQLAAAFGVDYQEIAPLMTGNLGSSQQSEIMHLKTRGKGPALIMGMFEDAINELLPKNVEFKFMEQDIRSEREKAETRFTRVKARSMQIKAGELTAKAAREMAVLDGDLPRWLKDEVDKEAEEREKEMQVNMEQPSDDFGPTQLEEGVETETGGPMRLDMEGVKRLQKMISQHPYDVMQKWVKSSVGYPDGTVVLPVARGNPMQLNNLMRGLTGQWINQRVRFAPEHSYHITLVYSPLVDDAEFRIISKNVENELGIFPLMLTSSRLDYFDTQNGKAVILRIDDNPMLRLFQDKLYREFTALGVSVSEFSIPKQWNPHITLAYVDSSVDIVPTDIEPIMFHSRMPEFTRSDYRVDFINALD